MMMMMTTTDYAWLFVLYCTDYFANYVEQHLVPYEYAGISMVVIEASKWLL